MSSYRAIAGVSSTLSKLLKDRMQDPVSVTIAPPDVTLSEITGKRLNLYLYHVTENGNLKNQEIPTHGYPGAYGHPPLSLDLHYLITAYGGTETSADADLEAQQILGDAMRVLYDFPIVSEHPTIVRSEVGTVGNPILDVELLGEFEKIKVTHQPMTLEDLSKLWAAMPETNFRRSVAYQVSVVQIESARMKRYPLPVGEPKDAGPRVYALTFRSPRINEIRVIRQDDPEKNERPYPYARVGDTLVILGRNFVSEHTRVLLGAVDVTAEIEDGRIETVVPDIASLQPGAQPVQVVMDVMIGEPPKSHLGFRSNHALFMLVPHVEALDTSSPGELKISGSRLFSGELECLTLIGDTAVHSGAYTSSGDNEIAFDLPGLDSGDYLIRVRVGGAESLDDRVMSVSS